MHPDEWQNGQASLGIASSDHHQSGAVQLLPPASAAAPSAGSTMKQTISTGIWDSVKVFLRRSLLWWGVYCLGCYHYSFAFVLIPLILSSGYEEKKLQDFSQAKRLAGTVHERDRGQNLIVARVDDVPAWVFFPDFERSEWLNKFLHLLWPKVEGYVDNLLRNSIQPMVVDMSGLKHFRFTNVSLGQVTPRIGGIKSYDKKTLFTRDEILMDVEVSWASDCDISLVLTRTADTLTSSTIRDLYMQGTLRVSLAPLIPEMPLIAGIRVAFLTDPRLDFDLEGLANIADMPGLSRVLRKLIIEQIAKVMVMPNSVYIPLINDVPKKLTTCPEPIGVICFNLVQAVDLMRMDIGLAGRGLSDPYAVIRLSGCDAAFDLGEVRTDIIKKSIDPVWNKHGELVVMNTSRTSSNQSVLIELWDWDQGRQDEFLGRATLPVSRVQAAGNEEFWLVLESATSGKIRIKTEWLELSMDAAVLADRFKEAHHLGLSSAILLLYVDSCRHLPPAAVRASSKPCPRVVSTVTGQVTQVTNVERYTKNPDFDQGFVFLVNNPDGDALSIVVEDSKTKSALGRLRIPLCQLLTLPNMEMSNQPFKLKDSNNDSVIVLNMRLMYLKKAGPPSMHPSSGGDSSTTVDAAAAAFRRTESIRSKESGEGSPPVGSSCPAPPSLEVSFAYIRQTKSLKVGLIKLRCLPEGLDDFYLKMYLLPEGESSKRKTGMLSSSKAIDDEVRIEETFSYENVSLDELNLSCLKVSLNRPRAGLFSRKSASFVAKTLICVGDMAAILSGADSAEPLVRTFIMDRSEDSTSG